MINSLYIHYPYCKHLCHYCDFYKNIATEGSANEFINSIRSSLETHQKFLTEEGLSASPLETLYMGGGTPSLMGKNFKEFRKLLEEYFDLTQLKEFSLEVDPGTCTREDLQTFKELGVNRMSLGIQSFDPLVQPFLDRSHNHKDIVELLEDISSLSINYSVDFMLGLAHPNYLVRDIEKELKEILSFYPNHVSLYILSVGKSYPFNDLLPSDEMIAEEYKKVHDYLVSQGFIHYEVSNYAKENFESAHNWKYWNQENYMALGPSATGLLSLNHGGIRYKWSPDNKKISQENLTKEQLYLEKLYTSLRTKKGVNLNEFTLDKKVLTEFEKQGYGRLVSDWFCFNDRGWVILDSLVDKLL